MAEPRKSQVQKIRNARAQFIAANSREGTKLDRGRANALLDALIRTSTREEQLAAYDDDLEN